LKGQGQALARQGSGLVRSFFRFSHRMLLARGMVRWVMRFTANPRAIYRYPHMRELVQGVYEPLRFLDMEAMLTWYAALADMDLTNHLGRIRAETLVVAGTADPLVSCRESVRIAERVRGAELQLIERVGHVPFLEAPDRFQQVVGNWAGRHGLN
jgi:pimeloyl-ACP methyl ester carboxylesterase